MHGNGRGHKPQDYVSQDAMAFLSDLRDHIGMNRDGVGGLVADPRMGRMTTLQEGRMGPGDAQCCASLTSCMRSVSQRSLSEQVRFSSEQSTVTAGTNILTLISSLTLGAVPGIGLERDSFVFNDSNVNPERARIEDLVLLATRAKIRVWAVDAEPIAAGAINVGDLANELEDIIGDTIHLSLFHTSDDADPWMDQTPLSYFRNDNEDFLPVPPLKWWGRDPRMALSTRAIEFGEDPSIDTGIPLYVSSVRDIDFKLDISIESIWIPDPDICGDFWPGMICPREHVGLTDYYQGVSKAGNTTGKQKR